jgi:hypothetical protein
MDISMTFDLDVGLIDAPAPAHGPFVFAQCFFKHRQQFDHPPVHARMVHLDTPLGHHFFEVTEAQ